MAASSGVIVPTFAHANEGEGSRLLSDDLSNLETVSLEPELAGAIAPDFVPRLSKRVVWMYGIGETGVWASHVILGFYLNTFLLEVAGLEASNFVYQTLEMKADTLISFHPTTQFKAGNILLVGQVWDAIINPIIGIASDSITTRWGRRRPWLLFAAAPFSICYFGIWMVWYDASQGQLFAYYLIMYLIFATASNAIAVPFTALTSDLASTYDHATELTQARMLCNLVIGVTCSFSHSVMSELFHYPRSKELVNYRLGYLLSAVVWAILFLFPPLVVFFGVREKPFVPKEEQSVPFLQKIIKVWKGVFGTLKNKAFAMLTAFYFLSWTAVQMVQNNLFLYTKYVLRKEAIFQWNMLIIQLVAAASLFGWSLVSRKIGKRLTFIIGLGIWFLLEICLFFLNDKTPVFVHYITCTICALGISVTFLIPWSMIPDIIDEDEITYGSRREGVFYSLFVLFQKIGLAAALASSSYALSGAGYISPAQAQPEADPLYQPKGVILVLKLICGPIPAVMLGLAIIISFFYPLGRAKVAENAKILAERHATARASKTNFVPKQESDTIGISADELALASDDAEHQ